MKVVSSCVHLKMDVTYWAGRSRCSGRRREGRVATEEGEDEGGDDVRTHGDDVILLIIECILI